MKMMNSVTRLGQENKLLLLCNAPETSSCIVEKLISLLSVHKFK